MSLHVPVFYFLYEFMNIVICACVLSGTWALACVLTTLQLKDPKCVGTVWTHSPKSVSFFHSLWVYRWLCVTCKSPTHNSVEPKPSTAVIWASGIPIFMYCNYFISSCLSNFIHTYLGVLLVTDFGMQKTILGALPSDSALSHGFLWTLVIFSDVIFSSWCYGIPMLDFRSAFLYTCPGRPSSPFSITGFCFCLA